MQSGFTTSSNTGASGPIQINFLWRACRSKLRVHNTLQHWCIWTFQNNFCGGLVGANTYTYLVSKTSCCIGQQHRGSHHHSNPGHTYTYLVPKSSHHNGLQRRGRHHHSKPNHTYMYLVSKTSLVELVYSAEV